MLVLRLFGDYVCRPPVRGRITVAVKPLVCVVAEQSVNLVLAVAPVGIKEVRQVLCESHHRNAVLSRRRLKQRVLLNREVVRLVFPQEHRARERRHIQGSSQNLFQNVR